MINKERLIKITRDLIRINSSNPPGDESRIGSYVKRFFDIPGLKVRTVSLKPRRVNVLVHREGTGNKTLLIAPHMDTVPAGTGWKYPPFSGRVENGRIYGRGATDCKCNLAVAMEVLRRSVEEGRKFPFNILLAACADEETGSAYGIKGLLEKDMIKADAALVLDSDDFNIIAAQKGLMHFRVKVHGKKAHGAYPNKGINAIESAAGMISDLKRLRLNFRKHPLLKDPTVNIGTITGGDKVNVVADYCEFSVDIRFLPGMDDKIILRTVKKLLFNHDGRSVVEIDDMQDPYEIDPGCALVDCLMRAAKMSGLKPRISGSEGATVITFFQKKKIPAVSVGFGKLGCAHITDEYARIADICKGADMLESFLSVYKG